MNTPKVKYKRYSRCNLCGKRKRKDMRYCHKCIEEQWRELCEDSHYGNSR